MKRLVITTIVLLAAAVYITVLYFRGLNPPGVHTSHVMETIPNNAAIIFEFNNEKSFYDIFNNDKLLVSVAGKEQLDDIDSVRDILLGNALFKKFFDGQNVFISLH